VTTLGAELVGGPGPPATPTRRTLHRITQPPLGTLGAELAAARGYLLHRHHRTLHRIACRQ